MKYNKSLRGILEMLRVSGCRVDCITMIMVQYCRFGAKALGQDIVRELIGSVKRLRVSRHSPSTPGRSNKFACCKAVVGRNVRNFVRRYLAEESANALPLFVFLTGQSHGLYRNTKGRISFCV